MYKRLKEVTDNYITAGIFSALQALDIPWQDNDMAEELNLLYYSQISGGKIISPLVDDVLQDAEKLTAEQIATLANIAYKVNKDNWARIFELQNLSYDPIENYNMTEDYTETREGEHAANDTRTDNLTDQRTLDTEHTKTGTETDTPNTTREQQDKISGFNSSTDVNANSQNETVTGTDTITYNTADADDGTITDTHTGTQTNGRTGTESEDITHTLTRSGNIGVTTSQQMLQAERELRLYNYFYDFVFPSIDKILTINVY